eukprot:m.42145 g.42145  ORF g.42145 m.42145 type:complete len:1637 (-) comp5705_c0_seq2:205-5115(-)
MARVLVIGIQEPALNIIQHVVAPFLRENAVLYETSSNPRELATIDFAACEAVVVCGDDKDIAQIMAPLLAREDPRARALPVAIVPSSGLSMLAAELDCHKDASQRVQRVLASLLDKRTFSMDVLEIQTAGGARTFALAGLGWGLFGLADGLVPLCSPQLWHGPALDLGAFLSQLQGHPLPTVCRVSFLEDGATWQSHLTSATGLFATKLSRMANVSITEGSRLDSGKMVVCWLQRDVSDAAIHDLVQSLTKGAALDEIPGLHTVVHARELKIEICARVSTGQYNIDGAPLPPQNMHVRVLPRHLTVMAPYAADVVEPFESPVTLLRPMCTETTSASLAKCKTISLPTLTPMKRYSIDDDASVSDMGRQVTKMITGALSHPKPETPDSDQLFTGFDKERTVYAVATRSKVVQLDFLNDTRTLDPAELKASVLDAINNALSGATPLVKHSPAVTLSPSTTSLAEAVPVVSTPELDDSGSLPEIDAPNRSIERQRHHRAARPKRRFFLIVYNPVSGKGKAGEIVREMIEPALREAGLGFKTLPTNSRGHATLYIQTDYDPHRFHGIIVCGGDGMVSEVITGLMTRTDNASDRTPVAIIPVGTANAMAHEMDQYESKSFRDLVAKVLLAVVGNQTRVVDIMETKGRLSTKYGLSCTGWGLAGAVGLQADKLRWLPGQRSARYDIAGFITMLGQWPLSCTAAFSYVDAATGVASAPEIIGVVNLIASSLPRLGVDHPICPDLRPDDGKMAICIIDDSKSRLETIQAALSMKKGRYLSTRTDHVRTIVASEFSLEPVEGAEGADIPYNIDGDPFAAQPVTVRILQRRLRLFASPAKQRKELPQETCADLETLDMAGLDAFTAADIASPACLCVMGGATDAAEPVDGPLAKRWAELWEQSGAAKNGDLARLYCMARDAATRGAAGKVAVWYAPDDPRTKAAAFFVVAASLKIAGINFILEPLHIGAAPARIASLLADPTHQGFTAIAICGDHPYFSKITSAMLRAGLETPVAMVPASLEDALGFELDARRDNETSLISRQSAPVEALLAQKTVAMDVIRVRCQDDDTFATAFWGWNVDGIASGNTLSDVFGDGTTPEQGRLSCRLTYTDDAGVQVSRFVAIKHLLTTTFPQLGANLLDSNATLDSGRFTLIYSTEITSDELLRRLTKSSQKKGQYVSQILTSGKKYSGALTLARVKSLTVEVMTGAFAPGPFLADSNPIEARSCELYVLPRALHVFSEASWLAPTSVDPADNVDHTDEEEVPDTVTPAANVNSALMRSASLPTVHTPQRNSLLSLFRTDPLSLKSVAKRYIQHARNIHKSMALTETAPLRYLLMVNPSLMDGKAREVVDQLVVPILEAASIHVVVKEVRSREHVEETLAAEIVTGYSGVLACGGDDMLGNIATALLTSNLAFPVGIVPLGTANAVNCALDLEALNTAVWTRFETVAKAVLRVVTGRRRAIELLRVDADGTTRYAVSAVCWGLIGGFVAGASTMNWVKTVDLDLASFIGEIQNWPVVFEGSLHYRDRVSQTVPIATVGMVASVLHRLGPEYAIDADIPQGQMSVIIAGPDITKTRAIDLVVAMRKGVGLAQQSDLRTVHTSEFRLEVLADTHVADVPLAVDGTPVQVRKAVAVTVVPRGLEVFA